MTNTVTGLDALTALRRAVERRGAEFVYQQHFSSDGPGDCSYVVDTDYIGYKHVKLDQPVPACLIGEALITDLGVPLAEFLPGGNLADDNDSSFGALIYVLGNLGFTFDDAAVEIFCVAQRIQDDGQPWGNALKEAELAAKRLVKRGPYV